MRFALDTGCAIGLCSMGFEQRGGVGLDQRHRAALELLAPCVQVALVVGIVAASFRRVLGAQPRHALCARHGLCHRASVSRSRSIGHLDT